MRFVPTKIAGAVIVELEMRRDERGAFARTFCTREFADAGIPFEVVQANLSINPVKHTLRGLHFQRSPSEEPKIVSCRQGRIWDVAVDVRPDSTTYLQWTSVELDAASERMFYIGKGLAHGFITLEHDTEVGYLMGAAYDPEASAGLRWNDPRIGIDWPAEPALISDRDASYPLLI